MPDKRGNKRAIITGITGQDDAYLSKLLIEKGYEVHGISRRSSHFGLVEHQLRWLGVLKQVRLHEANISDLSSLIRVVQEVQPEEFYNLAAQSFVATSWNQPLVSGNITALGVTNALEAIRLTKPDTRFFIKLPRLKCTASFNSPNRARPHPATHAHLMR